MSLVERDVIRATAAAQGFMSAVGMKLSPDGVWSTLTQSAYDKLSGSDASKADALMSAVIGKTVTGSDIAEFRRNQRSAGERTMASLSDTKDVEKVITAVALSEGVPPKAALQFAKVESNLNPNARSATGASGLFQLTEPAIKQIGIPAPNGNRFDPVWNATVGVKYMKWVARYLKTDFTNLGEIYAGYNLGVGNVALIKAGKFDDPRVQQALVVQAKQLKRGGATQYLANAQQFVERYA